jgi:hypothetical protein
MQHSARLILKNVLLAGVAVATLVGVMPRGLAADSPYCRKVHARAAADAAVLMWPQLLVQGIKYPAGVTLDPSLGTLTRSASGDFQLRTGFAYSLIDLFKGFDALIVGDADCAQHDTWERLEELLSGLDDVGKLSALRRQAAYLEAHRSEWQALRARAEERFAARVISIVELGDLQARTVELERKMVRVQGEAERIAARALPGSPDGLPQLADAYVERSLKLEQLIARARRLDGWQVRVTAGMVPTNQPPDWFGLVELSVNFGVFARLHKDRQAVAARADELAQARYELPARIREWQKQLLLTVRQARRELAIVEEQQAFVMSTRQSLQAPHGANVAHALAITTLDEILVQSDLVYLRAFVGELTSFMGDEELGT